MTRRIATTLADRDNPGLPACTFVGQRHTVRIAVEFRDSVHSQVLLGYAPAGYGCALRSAP